MVEASIAEYFSIGGAVGIIGSMFVVLYFSRKQMKILSADIETKILNDMDERIRGITQMGVELDNGTDISAQTIIWAGGGKPQSILSTLPCEHDKSGRIMTNNFLEVLDSLIPLWCSVTAHVSPFQIRCSQLVLSSLFLSENPI